MRSPSPPDPFKTAQAQTQQNQSTAISQQLLNMVNQVTPQGTLTYNQTGNNTYYDPTLKRDVTIPSFTATTQYTPEQQALFQQQQEFDRITNGLAINQANNVADTLSEGFSYDPGQHESWATGLYDKINGDRVGQQQSDMATRLANQGLQPGTAAYDDAMRNLTYAQEKARNDFMLNSYGQGYQTARDEYTLPVNVSTALMSGQQVGSPNFGSTPQTGVNGVDLAGLVNAKYQADSANAQARNGGLMSLGSTILGGLFALSDKRAKTNIKKVGKLDDGTNIYSYEYKPEHGGKKGLMHLGVMAGEAEKKHPDAVMTGDDGLKRVNYSKIAEELAQ